jgi:glycine C-acetyltransferase
MKRAVVITDGVFSMRGDVAPLDRIQVLVDEYNDKFDEGVIFIVDDSHGIAAFGRTGRGAIEVVNNKAPFAELCNSPQRNKHTTSKSSVSQ